MTIARVLYSSERTVPLIAKSHNIGNLREVLGRVPSTTVVAENGWTDLHYAAALNLLELATALLDSGMDVAVPIKADGEPTSERLKRKLRAIDLVSDLARRGFTPLHMAALNNAEEAAALLISRGADIEVKAAPGGLTPLQIAEERGYREA